MASVSVFMRASASERAAPRGPASTLSILPSFCDGDYARSWNRCPVSRQRFQNGPGNALGGKTRAERKAHQGSEGVCGGDADEIESGDGRLERGGEHWRAGDRLELCASLQAQEVQSPEVDLIAGRRDDRRTLPSSTSARSVVYPSKRGTRPITLSRENHPPEGPRCLRTAYRRKACGK